jgi:RimJ/RimL family protein N-acetyltransferase
VEAANDPDVARFATYIYPIAEHELAEFLKKELEDHRVKSIVAEVDGDPAGSIEVSPEPGRSRHVAWLEGLIVRKKHWGKGVGRGLMSEALSLAGQLSCRKAVLTVTEGNERAIKLYQDLGFEIEAHQSDHVYIDGVWRREYFMGLEIQPCQPELETSAWIHDSVANDQTCSADVQVKHLMNSDLDEVNKLQNCPDSTKTSSRVPPTTKEETKQWYENLKFSEGKYCLACFQGKLLLGYLQFRVGRPPFANISFEEMILDAKQKPDVACKALMSAVKGFRERYGYRKIFARVPKMTRRIPTILEQHGFKETGILRACYFTDGKYVSQVFYEYP